MTALDGHQIARKGQAGLALGLAAIGSFFAGTVATIMIAAVAGPMASLGFLLMIGTTLIADGFGFHVAKGYIYAAMAFSALVEGLNMLARARAAKR